ncbi:hypothetical protein [Microbacterium sp. W4I20]|jgi:hypothetical protein|uniref:hypothetical protein n=1 Tax=Microbacterium sp. W4I20 TaxID=3042262 RepID=UPI002781288C|nr:hypothetical protein [Microbacterium sp. W4I20]MDQ0728332.1 hypothetical protein [Microbacterium sp. W4I20]
MTDPQTYPEDSGPFDAAAEAAVETPQDEKVFTADDGVDHEKGETDPLEEGD